MIEVKKIALPTAVYKAMMNFMDQSLNHMYLKIRRRSFREEAKRNEKGIVEIKVGAGISKADGSIYGEAVRTG